MPRSTNTAGWSHLLVPIVTINGGDGPTVLVLGGVHGDEPEGQVAALRLARETEPADVNGPAHHHPVRLDGGLAREHAAVAVGRELQPLVPGPPDGPLDEQLSDFITRYLIAEADVVIDMHSGGRSSLFGVWSEMHWVDDAEQRRKMVDAMLAWNTPMHFVYIDVAGTGLLVGEAERQGKIVVATELGGGGHVLASTHRVAIDGLRNVLRHFGVLAGEVETRESLGLEPAVIVRATDDDNYLFAPDAGHWETLVDVGDRVEQGQLVGRIHFIDRPDREPTPVVLAARGRRVRRARDRAVRAGRQRARDRPADRRRGAPVKHEASVTASSQVSDTEATARAYRRRAGLQQAFPSRCCGQAC